MDVQFGRIYTSVRVCLDILYVPSIILNNTSRLLYKANNNFLRANTDKFINTEW